MNKIQRTLALLAGSALIIGAAYKTVVAPSVPPIAVVAHCAPVDSLKAKVGYHLTKLDVVIGSLLLLVAVLGVALLVIHWHEVRTKKREASSNVSDSPTPISSESCPDPAPSVPLTKVKIVIHDANAYLFKDTKIQEVLMDHNLYVGRRG